MTLLLLIAPFIAACVGGEGTSSFDITNNTSEPVVVKQCRGTLFDSLIGRDRCDVIGEKHVLDPGESFTGRGTLYGSEVNVGAYIVEDLAGVELGCIDKVVDKADDGTVVQVTDLDDC
jgi:hypothetical protein